MDPQKSRYGVDWGHLIFLAVIGCAALWYLGDAMSVSLNIHNLLLVAPLCVLAVGLCIAIAPQCFLHESAPDEPLGRNPHAAAAASLQSSDKVRLLQIGSVALSLGLYVSLLTVIGFDVATFFFVMAVMVVCGERRRIVLIVYPLVVAVVLISAFRALLPYPMFTAIL
jgi:hypothetical protein